MVVLRVLLMVVAFGALAVLGWHIRQRLRTISLRRSSSGGHPYLELLKEPNGWLLGFFAPIGLLVLITAGFVLPTAVTVVAFVWILMRFLGFRMLRPRGRTKTEHVDAWAVAGQRFKLSEEDEKKLESEWTDEPEEPLDLN